VFYFFLLYLSFLSFCSFLSFPFYSLAYCVEEECRTIVIQRMMTKEWKRSRASERGSYIPARRLLRALSRFVYALRVSLRIMTLFTIFLIHVPSDTLRCYRYEYN
jgi:hypothetical protein